MTTQLKDKFIGKVTFLGIECHVVLTTYAENQRSALILTIASGEDEGQPMATATVNILDFDLPDGYVLIKNYSENTGILYALAAAGIIKDTGSIVDTGYVHANICKLLIGVDSETTTEEIPPLTEDDVFTLKFLWDKYEDIQRFSKYDKMTEKLTKYHPELLKAMNDFEIAKKTITTLIEAL